MTAIRSLFAQRKLAVLLCAAALLLKLLIPNGYMVGQVDGHAAIILCPASGPVPDLSATGHGKTHDAWRGHGDGSRHDGP